MIVGRSVKLLIAVVSVASLFAVDAQAQSRRSSSRYAGKRASTRTPALPPGFGFGTHPGFSGKSGSFVPIGAATGATTPPPPAKPITPPAGYVLPGSNFSTGFFGRVEHLHGGTYVPGWGVNNGFALPEPVCGGMYVPGWGVNNGFSRPEMVTGGAYIPGFGVTGTGSASGGGGFGPNTAVKGGNLMPGFGVVAGIR